ncbi:hypothetical protein BGX30_007336, partial [Mortierella sp. GBA39]
MEKPPSGGVPEVDQAIGSLAMLQTLHRYGLNANSNMAVKADVTPFGSVALRELVDYGRHFYISTSLLEAAVQRSSATIE